MGEEKECTHTLVRKGGGESTSIHLHGKEGQERDYTLTREQRGIINIIMFTITRLFIQGLTQRERSGTSVP